jgi:predicted nucleic-acid-binding Zn-ribbon protein
MSSQKSCPSCGNSLFLTKRMTLNWFQVLLALIPSAVIFYLLKLVVVDSHPFGKLTIYIILCAVGLVGSIFAKGISKRWFHVESCTRCDYVNTKEIVDT